MASSQRRVMWYAVMAAKSTVHGFECVVVPKHDAFFEGRHSAIQSTVLFSGLFSLTISAVYTVNKWTSPLWVA